MKSIYFYLIALGITITSCKNIDSNNAEYFNELEKDILVDLHSNLTQNLEDINSNIENLKISKKANEIIVQNMNNNIQYHDSLNYHFANLYPYQVFSPNETTFNYLNHTGLFQISNDSIRADVSDLYGVHYKLYKSFETTYFVEHYTNYIKPMFIAEFSAFSFYDSFSPINYSQFIRNQEYKRIMSYSVDAIASFIFLQSRLKEKVEVLLDKIDDEFKS